LEELAATSSGGLEDFRRKHVVFKCGRTTGKTRGVLNSIDSSVQMSSGDNVPVVGRTLLVFAFSGSTKGDAGSLVFDYRGKVLGIYVGGQNEGLKYHDDNVVPRITGRPVTGIHFISPIGPTMDGIRAAVRNDPAFGGLDVNVEFLWGPAW
jgi:hypothetical protein